MRMRAGVRARHLVPVLDKKACHVILHLCTCVRVRVRVCVCVGARVHAFLTDIMMCEKPPLIRLDSKVTQKKWTKITIP